MTPTRQFTARRFLLRDEPGNTFRATKEIVQFYTETHSSGAEWNLDEEWFQLVDGRRLKQITEWLYELVGSGERLTRIM